MDVVPFSSVALRRVPIAWHLPALEESKRGTPRMSREERKLHGIALQFGRPIASATTVEVAGQRVAETVESPAFAKALSDLRSLFDFDSMRSMSAEGIAKETAPLLGKPAARLIEQGMRDEFAVLASQLNLMLAIGTDQKQRAPTTQTESHLAFVYDPELPLTVIEALLGTFSAQAALFGLLHALLTETKPKPRVARYLAETYRDGIHAYLRVLASIPEAGVPASLVSADERYDLDALKLRHDEFWRDVANGTTEFGEPDDE